MIEVNNVLEQQLADESRRLVWIDSWGYCSRLFLDDKRLDWGSRAKVDEFVRKADSLIKSDVITLPLLDYLQHTLQRMPRLITAMKQKSRAGYALKTLLRDPEVRRQVHDAIKVVVAAFPLKAVVLSVPAPRALLGWAYQAAQQRQLEEVTMDHADSASVYVSDFLSSLSGTGVSGVLIEEVCPGEELWRLEAEIYVPMRNVTAHQRWQMGLRLGFCQATGSERGIFDFVLAPANKAGTGAGVWLGETFWSDQEAPPAGMLLYGVVPVDANPETVLSRRRVLG